MAVIFELEVIMKKRLFAVLFSSALLLTSLAGCGQGTGNNTEPGENTASTGGEAGTRDELCHPGLDVTQAREAGGGVV